MIESGRRSAARRRGPGATALIGVLLVLATAGGLSLVRQHELPPTAVRPTQTPLRAAALGCPTDLAGGTLRVTSSGRRTTGDARLLGGDEDRTVAVRSREVTTVEGVPGAAVVSAEGELAPDLLAARFAGGRLAAAHCTVPRPVTWFTGLGAGARHDSVLELVNPDAGLAVADVTVLGRAGPVEVPDLRGVTVRGHESLRFDLGEVLPRRGELSVQVSVSRGRLTASVLDRIPALGSEPQTEDWLTGQDEPTKQITMLGLVPGEGSHQVAVSNPGQDEARVTIRILTPDSAFTPSGLGELRVPAGSVRTSTLDAVVNQAVRDGAVGYQLSSTEPVTASARSVTAADLSSSVPVLPGDTPMTALLPTGQRTTVVLADASRVGVVTVAAWAATGRELEPRRVEVGPGQGGLVVLPPTAALVRVSPERTAISAAAVVVGDGATVVPFREPVDSTLVPDVRPGLR